MATLTIPDSTGTGGINYSTGLSSDIGVTTSFGFQIGTTFVMGIIVGVVVMWYLKHKPNL